MDKLSSLPNIGNTLEKKLIEVGIESVVDLKRIGSKEAFIRIKGIDKTACFNMLCALEGAVKDVRWHYLAEESKNDLKNFFKSL